jgi:hypothetical protein
MQLVQETIDTENERDTVQGCSLLTAFNVQLVHWMGYHVWAPYDPQMVRLIQRATCFHTSLDIIVRR